MLIDFKPLTDDQLVELVRAACAEAVLRGSAIEAATRAAMLSEAEKATIARTAAEREAEKLRREEAERIAQAAAEQVRQQAGQEQAQKAADEQARLWGRQKFLGRLVKNLFGSGCTLTVWNKGDKRVYIDNEPGTVRVEFYSTGNHRNPPGTLKISVSEAQITDKALVKRVVEHAAKSWNSLPRMDCDQASNAAVAPLGDQQLQDDVQAFVDAQREAREKTLNERLQEHRIIRVGRKYQYKKSWYRVFFCRSEDGTQLELRETSYDIASDQVISLSKLYAGDTPEALKSELAKSSLANFILMSARDAEALADWQNLPVLTAAQGTAALRYEIPSSVEAD